MEKSTASSPSSPSHETACPISVGKCYAQTANDRVSAFHAIPPNTLTAPGYPVHRGFRITNPHQFGPGAKNAVRDRERVLYGLPQMGAEIPFTWPGPGADDNSHTAARSMYQIVPSMQFYRNNLTALSQAYNLYLVAYQGHIFVYRPRDVPRQRIPRDPDVHIIPPQSTVARSIGGTFDVVNHHVINHLITGFLGHEEIVVACFDDGDVVAYYLSAVEHQVSLKMEHASSDLKLDAGSHIPAQLRPFLLENVGISAWGLAIHRKTRLIAVSSNRHEITVFAPAIIPEQVVEMGKPHQACECPICCPGIEYVVRRRVRNWRIVVQLGQTAKNLPNICFLDDEQGGAEQVCGIDIDGYLWIAHIWKTSQPAVKVPHSDPYLMYRGWAAVALSDSDFLKVSTVQQMLGLLPDESEIVPGSSFKQTMVNVQRRLAEMEDNPCRQQQTARPIPNHAYHVAAFLGPMPTLPVPLPQIDDIPEAPWNNADEDEEEDEDEEVQVEVEVEFEFPDPEFEEAAQNGEDLLDDDVEDDDPEWFMPAVFVEADVDEEGIAASSLFPSGHASWWHSWTEMDTLYGASAVQDDDPPQKTPKKVNGGGSPKLRGFVGERNPRTPSTRQKMGFCDMAYLPHRGVVRALPRSKRALVDFLTRTREHNFTESHPSGSEKPWAGRYHMFRTFEQEIELKSLDTPADKSQRAFGTICTAAIPLESFTTMEQRHHFHATKRLSMVVHVPELHLIVVGSATGRALLLTPTKLQSPIKFAQGRWERGFRLEKMLPREKDESMHKQRRRALHGLAIGPVQRPEGPRRTGVGESWMPGRRYRLMLHYRDHDILTYEIERHGVTGELYIF
ncbi:hypothetical protein S40288_03878 [Stachybotrys chartarum IBT 40288]|nr:hypothetical protein S40288_03878 [Stachybotrys chartarum IBT 40288]